MVTQRTEPRTERRRQAHPGAERFVSATHDLDELAAAVQGCRGCDLYQHASQAVFGRGAAHAQVLLLGEQPGDQEDRRGEPFVGPAGGPLRPTVVAALGASAGEALFGPKFRVGKARGTILDWPVPDEWREWDAPPDAAVPVVATVHPSAVLRAPDRDEALAGLVEDLRSVTRLLPTHDKAGTRHADSQRGES